MIYNVNKEIKHWASYLTDALFPRRCPVCGEIVMPKGQLICRPCLKELSLVKSPVCKKCGKEVIGERIEYCFDCTRHKRTFEYGIALFNYNEAAKRAMAGIKYKNRREYLDFFADAAVKRCLKKLALMQADVLIPVPVHPSRLRKRGFNQAEVFANYLSPALNIPVCTDILVRSKKTDPQKGLNPSERLKNLEKAFAIDSLPPGVSNVILIDDIYTTGSTMEACARVLMRAGVKKVCFFAVCIGQGQ